MFDKETQIQVAEAQNFYCANEGCYEKIHSTHHKLHDNVTNQFKFPLFIDSIFNAIGLCMKCHRDFSHKFRITIAMAELFENYLRKMKENK